MKYRRTLAVFAFITLLSAFALMFYVFWSIFYPFKTVEYKTYPAKIITPVVEAGGYVVYELDVCRYTDKLATVSRQFIDGVVYSVPSFEQKLPTGCRKTFMQVPVPDTLQSGEYFLRILLEFEINKIRNEHKMLETEKFQVVGKDLKHELEDLNKFDILLQQ